MQYHYSPSSFNKDAVAPPIKRPLGWRWESLESALKEWRPQIVMTLLPPFWQTELPLHAACKKVGAPLYTNQPHNLALATIAIKLTGIDTVIVEAKHAQAFAEELAAKKISLPKNWMLIYPLGEAVQVPEILAQQRVILEAQTSPGVTHGEPA